jgi:PAS domain S-box-containing protein
MEQSDQMENNIKELQEQNRKNRDLLEAAFEFFWEVNLGGRFVSVSPSVEKVLGYAPAEVVGRSVYDLVWPGEVERVEKAVSTAAAAKQPFRVTNVFRHKSGKPVWLDCRGVPVFGPGGDLIGYRGADMDVTEEKLAKERLQESEGLYRGLVEAITESLVTLDAQGVVTYVNRRLCEISGYSREELVGHSWEEFLKNLGVESQKFVEGQMRHRLLKGRLMFDLQWTGKDGKEHFSLVSSTPIITATGERRGSLAVLTDITERKKAEEALEESERNLRSLFSQLSAIQDRERQEISHELHDTALQTISAAKYNLEETLDGKNNYIGHIRKAIPMLQRSMDEIRTISLGLHPSLLDDFGVLATMDWLVREFRKSYPGIDIQVIKEIQEEDIPEEVKRVLFLVIQEALSNISRHSRAEKASICLEKKGGRIHLMIQDGGIGFDPAILKRPESGKTPFGLLNLKERVAISGGKFQIHSEPGKGTELWASWPPGA